MNEFWQEFLAIKHLDKQTKYASAYHFELTEKLATELLNLVLIGKKRATSSSLKAYEIGKEALPKGGDYNIITDFKGVPYGVVKTSKVTVLPYKEMTFELCKKEGEDDSLESWQRGHEHFFKEEGKEMGYEFNEDLMVVFEEFELVYQKPLIRLATKNDAQARGYVHFAAWQETYIPIMGEEFLAHQSLERSVAIAREHYADTLLAIVAGQVVGFLCFTKSRDADEPNAGEIQALYLLKKYQHQGIGYQLMRAGEEKLKEYPTLLLWVLLDNNSAIKFYEQCGFKKDGKKQAIPLKNPVYEIRMRK
jgi:uncharacterized protein YhfF/GNAT superfamily N-acetyltransferase